MGGIVSLAFAVSVIVHVTTLRTKVPGEEMTPAGTRNCWYIRASRWKLIWRSLVHPSLRSKCPQPR